MKTISLCMIVKNEEKSLGRCLKSVKGLVDEIIIVDTGSTDNTKEIAKEYGAKIYDFPWIDDFAAARNFSFGKATMDYILWLDGDDYLTPVARTKFSAAKKNLTDDVDLVMMDYNCGFDENGNPILTFKRERLLKRSKNYRWVGRIHEVILPSGQIAYWDIAVTHGKTEEDDADRNLRIFEKMKAEGEIFDQRQKFYYGRELYYHQRYDEAITLLRQVIDDKNSWVENRLSACVDLANCYYETGADDKGLDALLKAVTFTAPNGEICCLIGNHFAAGRNFTAAVFWYEGALRQKPGKNGGFVVLDYYKFLPCLGLCQAYYELGDKEQAYEYHLLAQAEKPNDSRVLANAEIFSCSLSK